MFDLSHPGEDLISRVFVAIQSLVFTSTSFVQNMDVQDLQLIHGGKGV